MSTRVYGSLARIADFANSNFEVQALPRDDWATGDYVEGEVTGAPTSLYQIEDRDGHMVRVEPGDWVIGAFGDRANAERRRKALLSGGIGGAFIFADDAATPPMYRVRIGPIRGVDDYDLLVLKLEALGISDPYLVTL